MPDNIDIRDLIAIAREAGEAIMKIYAGDIEVEQKEDASPLTLADKASNAVIVERLKYLYPSIPIISEENKLLPFEERKGWGLCWLVDPLDGTKEFIKRNGEFTVNIALVDNGQPILGVVYVPAREVTYYALNGAGSFKVSGDGVPEKLTIASYVPGEPLRLVGSRSHNTPEMDALVEELKAQYGGVEFVPAGSSLKFCLVAEGIAHEYPRLGPTMEWDTCAGQVVAEEAGAKVLEADSMQPLLYNKENLLNPYFLVTNPQVRRRSV